jgi:multidrug efflux pump subunit AcrB
LLEEFLIQSQQLVNRQQPVEPAFISEMLNLPPAIRVEYGGAYEEQQRSFRDLVIVLVLAVLLVFIVLLFEFGDFAAPLAILASALLSTSGVFLACS